MASKQVSVYDIGAPTVIMPPNPGNPILALVGYIPQMQGIEAGTLTFNDATSLSEASAENQIYNFILGASTTGPIIADMLRVPVSKGIVLSSIPSGLVLTIIYEIYVAGADG